MNAYTNESGELIINTDDTAEAFALNKMKKDGFPLVWVTLAKQERFVVIHCPGRLNDTQTR